MGMAHRIAAYQNIVDQRGNIDVQSVVTYGVADGIVMGRSGVCQNGNNFAFVQAAMMKAFGRTPIGWSPLLPQALLRAALRVKLGDGGRPRRRFSNDALADTGFRPANSFAARLNNYATFLSTPESVSA